MYIYNYLKIVINMIRIYETIISGTDNIYNWFIDNCQ